MIGLNQDLIVILFIVGILFGAKKLPEIGKGLGKGIKEFKDGLSDRESETVSTAGKIEGTTGGQKPEKAE